MIAEILNNYISLVESLTNLISSKTHLKGVSETYKVVVGKEYGLRLLSEIYGDKWIIDDRLKEYKALCKCTNNNDFILFVKRYIQQIKIIVGRTLFIELHKLDFYVNRINILSNVFKFSHRELYSQCIKYDKWTKINILINKIISFNNDLYDIAV